MEFEKHFTLEEAQATLPLVKRIVADIQEMGTTLREKLADLGESALEDPDIEQMIRDLEALGDELRRIGCEYKDPSFSLGLVDFPAVIDGQEVLLCWRTDEPEILYYHGLLEGYPGRKPVPGAHIPDPEPEESETRDD